MLRVKLKVAATVPVISEGKAVRDRVRQCLPDVDAGTHQRRRCP